MKRAGLIAILAGIALPGILLGCRNIRRRPKRIGMVIGMRPDRISAYEALHAASNAGLRDLLGKYHMHNFSIFLKELEHGRYYLFGYYEYTGTDYENDMAKLAAEPRNGEWLKTTDPMQMPLRGETSWSVIREVYYNA